MPEDNNLNEIVFKNLLIEVKSLEDRFTDLNMSVQKLLVRDEEREKQREKMFSDLGDLLKQTRDNLKDFATKKDIQDLKDMVKDHVSEKDLVKIVEDQKLLRDEHEKHKALLEDLNKVRIQAFTVISVILVGYPFVLKYVLGVI